MYFCTLNIGNTTHTPDLYFDYKFSPTSIIASHTAAAALYVVLFLGILCYSLCRLIDDRQKDTASQYVSDVLRAFFLLQDIGFLRLRAHLCHIAQLSLCASRRGI